MSFCRTAALVLIASAFTPAALALEPMPIGCSGVFGKEATEASLTARFGAANVIHKYRIWGEERDVARSESYLFVDDDQPVTGEVQVFWDDARGDDVPAGWTRSVTAMPTLDDATRDPVRPAFAWQTTAGVAIGMTLDELERLNGRPFTLTGEKGTSSMMLRSWNGGALDAPDGGCTTTLAFVPVAQAPDEADCARCGDHLSNEDVMRRWRGRVWYFTVSYPPDVAEHRDDRD